MQLSAIQVHRWWLTRMAPLLVVTGLIDVAVGSFATRPFLWASLVGASLPLSTVIFVVVSLLNQAKGGPRKGVRGPS